MILDIQMIITGYNKGSKMNLKIKKCKVSLNVFLCKFIQIDFKEGTCKISYEMLYFSSA